MNAREKTETNLPVNASKDITWILSKIVNVASYKYLSNLLKYTHFLLKINKYYIFTFQQNVMIENAEPVVIPLHNVIHSAIQVVVDAIPMEPVKHVE